jgi:hypothetical protein
MSDALDMGRRMLASEGLGFPQNTRNRLWLLMGMVARRGAIVRDASIPAPIGGLNARDSIAEMKATDALVLDNFVPGTTDCTLRHGLPLMGDGPQFWINARRDAASLSLGTVNKLFGVAAAKSTMRPTKGRWGGGCLGSHQQPLSICELRHAGRAVPACRERCRRHAPV